MINLCNYQWNQNVSNYLKNLQSESKPDVSLIGDDLKGIDTHKIVLEIGSIFFRNLLRQNQNNSKCSSNTIFYIRGVDSVCILNILQFLYTGNGEPVSTDEN